jgi:hypothetical protein
VSARTSSRASATPFEAAVESDREGDAGCSAAATAPATLRLPPPPPRAPACMPFAAGSFAASNTGRVPVHVQHLYDRFDYAYACLRHMCTLCVNFIAVRRLCLLQTLSTAGTGVVAVRGGT